MAVGVRCHTSVHLKSNKIAVLRGKNMMLFSDRKNIADAYEEWIKEHPDIQDCPINLITFMEMNNLVKEKNENMRFLFGDIVVVEDYLIGVIVKSWQSSMRGNYYEVYVRNYNRIKEYDEKDIERYKVRHKELNEEEIYYQNLY